MNRIKIRAVVLGLLVDIGGSVFVGILIGILVGSYAAYSHDTSRGHLAALGGNFYLTLLGLIGTTFSTGLGGYVSGRKALLFPIGNSLAVGAVSLLLGIALEILVPGVTPIWKRIAGLLLTVPAAVLGGYFASLRKIGRSNVAQ